MTRGRLLFWLVYVGTALTWISRSAVIASGIDTSVFFLLALPPLVLLSPFYYYLYWGVGWIRVLLITYYVAMAVGCVFQMLGVPWSTALALAIATTCFNAWATFILAASPSFQTFFITQQRNR